MCKCGIGERLPREPLGELRMRRSVVIALLSLSAVAPAHAQGWIIPRPCGIGVMPPTDREGTPPIAPPRQWPSLPIRDCGSNIVRTRSDVRVELADRVLRYEVEERFV